MSKWNRRFLDMAELVGSWSKDPSSKVGAVIVDANKRVVSVGYNGFPRGVDDSDQRLQDRETKLALVLHAEENALSFAQRSVEGCTIYVTRPPCSHCAAKIVQSGIYAVVYSPPDARFSERWRSSLELAYQVLKEGNVVVCGVTE